jgi:GT2 family glycosyltransferase
MLDEVRLPDGWFDRNYFMYYEDLDLGWRCRLAGYSAWFVPESFVLHKYHGSSERHGHSWLEVIQRINRLRTLLKNGSVRFWIENIFINGFDLLSILRHGGIRAAITLMKAVPASLKSRSAINRQLKVPREAVEQRWAG